MIARPEYKTFRKEIYTGDFIVRRGEIGTLYKVQHVDHSTGLLTIGRVNPDGSWVQLTLDDGRVFPVNNNIVSPNGFFRIADADVANFHWVR